MANPDSEVKTLLNFVNLASSDIKAALDRSAPCRRSVDHRKYLQKQLRRFALPRRPATCTRLSGDARDGPEARLSADTSARTEGDERPGQVPMRKRQLPASFWEEPLLRSSAHGTAHGVKRRAVYDDLRANPLLSEPQRRSVACSCSCSCACCPLQYRALLLPHADAPLRHRAPESSVSAGVSQRLRDGLHSGGAHVVIKPIPTKPVSASASIFSVFGFI